ncbi:MAG: type II secretion system GspH family protein, partial [Actinobacteria bacterium]|nr:type II secretion system GspH family protein [Actinomycetota bacterium]
IKRRGRKARGDRGFTIVELMITMLIMGILVTIVVMTMSVSQRKARESACKANLRILTGSIILYISTHEGNYPGSLEDLKPDYLKDSFDWTCPSGNFDYRDNYSPATGTVTCPEPGHEL